MLLELAPPRSSPMPAQLNPPRAARSDPLSRWSLPVIAGAGSGKTRVITQKIVHLISAGFSPQAIGAITFTNKAAQEMSERLGKMVKLPEGQRPLVSTFHSLGVQMLRRDGQSLGLKRNSSILDGDDSANILQQALGTTDRKGARAAQHRISLGKNALVDPDRAAAGAKDSLEHGIARDRDYAATLAAYQSVDFDDLIRLPVQRCASTSRSRRPGARSCVICSSTSTRTPTPASTNCALLVGPRAAFTAVGDDDQSIYGWRGATLENPPACRPTIRG